MKKNEMIDRISTKVNCPKKVVDAVLTALSDELLDVIANNDSFKLGEVVTIKGVDKPAREYRNPSTGEKFMKEASSGNPKAVFSRKAKE